MRADTIRNSSEAPAAVFMFVLLKMRENVKLSPQRMRQGFIPAIRQALGSKYCNRIVPKNGLCIAVFDVLEAGDPYVHPGHDASAHVNVLFRLLLFRPQLGEILEGVVRSSSEEGVRVTLQFYDDILIPPMMMKPQGMQFDATEQVWSWAYNADDPAERLYLDVGENIRVCVVGEEFNESPPVRKDAWRQANEVLSPPLVSSNISADNASNIVPQLTPYRVLASISECGLGLNRWWRPSSD